MHTTLSALLLLPFYALLDADAAALPQSSTCPAPALTTSTVSRFIRFDNADTNQNLNADMSLNFTIKTKNSPAVYPFRASMDTGSMGVVIGAKMLGLDNKALLQYPKGQEFLDSSGRYWEGYWIPASDVNLTFTAANVTSKVPILAVNVSSICHNYLGAAGCKPGSKTNVTEWPTTIHYLGVGFGRWSTEQPKGTPDKNPLINVAYLDGKPVASGTLRPGFVLTSSGVEVGLTTTNIKGFASMKLGVTASGQANDWAEPQIALAIDGSGWSYGMGLFDTGISQSYVRVNGATTAKEHLTKSTVDNKTSTVLTPATTVHMKFGSGSNFIGYYNVRAGDTKNPMRPAYGQFRPEAVNNDTAFINTGIKFYLGFNTFFDAQCGYWGLSWKGDKGSPYGGIDPTGPLNTTGS